MMDSTMFVATQVPHLRRFARVLTGSQAVADCYVEAVLRAVIDERPFDDEIGARRWLYRALLTLWTRIESEDAGSVPDPNRMVSSVDFNLMAVTPLPRAAFLLQSMEEFRVDEVADILQRSSIEVEHLVGQAGEELAALIRTDILIIEDEPIISMDLQILVEELGHYVPHIARTHQEAVSLADRCRPGLVLVDIHMADGGSGIEAVNAIVTSHEVPVVFLTAFPDAFERAESSIVVAKPYRAATVKAAISQALFFDIHTCNSTEMRTSRKIQSSGAMYPNH